MTMDLLGTPHYMTPKFGKIHITGNTVFIEPSYILYGHFYVYLNAVLALYCRKTDILYGV